MDCRHLDELYELYLLGLLSNEGAGELDDHLARDCPHCLARLREAAETIYFFMMTVPRSRPVRKSKVEVSRRIRRKP